MQALLKPGWLLALALGVGAVPMTFADTPVDPPAADADPFGGHEWELTPYLKGTAPQIRDKMNGEVERLIIRTGDLQKAIAKARSDTQLDEKAAADKMHKSPAYQQAAADKARAEADLEIARKSGTSSERVDASGQFNKARLAVETLEHDALVNNEDLSRDRHAVFDNEKELKRTNESLAKAVAWREELLDATRNAFMLHGPLNDGDKGTLPKITVEKIVDGNQIVVGFNLITFDKSHPGKDKEGIKSYYATTAKVHILVNGTDSSGLKVGQKFNLDRVFVVEGSKHDEENGTVYIVKPFPSDGDKLFDMIVPLRQTLPDTLATPPKG